MRWYKLMSDLLTQNAILSETILRRCSKCGHLRGSHPNDGKCEIKDCECKSFGK